ncbi:hypothetical protein CXG81DRAFT_4512, partial [Caulochytrium protostelioides]
KYMDRDDFIRAIAPHREFYAQPPERYGILFELADLTRTGRISLQEFVDFETVLAQPDAEYDLAFRLFDTERKGFLTLDEFRAKLGSTIEAGGAQIDFNADWFRIFFGKNPPPERVVTYEEFCQLVKGFRMERLKQEFRHFDPQGTGYITPDDFRVIMLHVAKHILSPFMTAHLSELAYNFGGKITFGHVQAFYNVLRQMDQVERVARKAISESASGLITRADFQSTASRLLHFATFSPLEVDMVFFMAGRDPEDKTKIVSRPPDAISLSLRDLTRLFTPAFGHKVPLVATPLTPLQEVLQSGYNFGLGAIGGAIGATVVYPIDLVKTRMQNQRKTPGQVLYRNSIDCFQKVIRNEGPRGLYRGLAPQLLGVAPEKAIKLTMNDLVRSRLTDRETGVLPLWAELAAGCAAGGSQVIFTNPLEIVKIRLQVAGEAAKLAIGAVPRVRAIHIVQELGLLGLYKGVTACLLRDVPFSAIYFPVYSHLKKDVFHEGQRDKKLAPWELLTAGAVAGMPAAYLVTPADVIKTRLQVAARSGETTYTGIRDAFVKILREEGPTAFFKGGLARVFRSSPQFGVTLASYELLRKAFPL